MVALRDLKLTPRVPECGSDPSRLVFREQHGGQPSPKKKGTGPSMTAGPLPMLVTASPLSYDRRGRGRSFSLADVLRTASDAQESEHCRHS